jgi:aminoglycoside phosphotransferase (APT) family kinase protein
MSFALEISQIINLFEKHTSLIPTEIHQPHTCLGQFNLIYFVTLPNVPSTEWTGTEFVLRLSMALHPRIKTQNEVGWLTFLSKKSTFNVPKVLFWSDSRNELGYEYTVVEKLSGETLCNIWETIDPALIVQKVVDIVLELRALTKELGYHWFGGITAEGTVNPFVEITSYTEKHICQYWPLSNYPNESYETLNLTTSFSSWNEYLDARLKRDIHVIDAHQSCVSLRTSFRSRLQKLLTQQRTIRAVQGYIAHRDLHFGNLLWSTETNSISAVLDWELAGVYLLSDWNPGNTCWTIMQPKMADSASQETLMKMLDDELEKRDTTIVEDLENEEYLFRKIVSLPFWIVFQTVTGHKDEETVQGWIKQWNTHTEKLFI